MPVEHRILSIALSVCTLFEMAAPGHLSAQLHRDSPPPGAKSHIVVPGPRYEAQGFKRWFFGNGYRDIWTAPVEVEVLDLENEAGGLSVLETGGYGQTFTLEFRAPDGLDYAVRSLDKDPTRRLDPLLQGTLVASIIQDQTSGFLPTAGPVVDVLLEAAGLLHPRHKLVVVPDDPRLGEFREEYAGLIGMFVDRPQEGPDNTPGFGGSRRISGTDRFIEELEEGSCVQADSREFLKARFIDLLVGDRDRHEGQWRWARFPDGPDCSTWRPIPEDRDQAFIYNDGVMMWLYRRVEPRMVRFGPEYPELYGLTFNGWEIDRQFLSELDEEAWVEVAEELREDITDEVIERAVRRLPSTHYDLRGPWIVESLKSRRNALTDAALRYYRMISVEVEVTGTDRDEISVFEHHADGSMTLTLTYADGPLSDAPHFRRTFNPEVTKEVRLFLKGGEDRVEVRGGRGEITVRAIGGGGDDVFINGSGASRSLTRFYDDRGNNRFDGPATVDEAEFEQPPSTNLVHQYALDWGRVRRLIPLVTYSPDIGAQFGIILGSDKYGFRKVPWASRQTVRAAVTSVGPEPILSWDARFRQAMGKGDALVHVEYSGINILRFHGFGNGTAIEDPDHDRYKVEQRELVLAPAIEWTFGYEATGGEEPVAQFFPKLRLGLGPILKHSVTPLKDNEDRFIGGIDPLPTGVGDYGQVGVRGWMDIDTRDNTAFPTRGIRLIAGGSVFPSAWDVEEAFGELHGSLSTFLTPGEGTRVPTLALRAGGKRVFGSYPFHEAAFVGGHEDVRGLRKERFAGDAALFANAELRIPLSRFSMIFPAELGILGAADVGRVFYDGDAAGTDLWHNGVGGGIWLSLMDRIQTVSLSIIKGEDVTGVYFRAGLLF